MPPIPEGGFPRAGAQAYNPQKLNGRDGMGGSDNASKPIQERLQAAVKRATLAHGMVVSEAEELSIVAEIRLELGL